MKAQRLESERRSSPMVRTQVYLTTAQHAFLSREAERKGDTMAGMIRRLIDAHVAVPSRAWTENPLLEDTPEDLSFIGPRDGAARHDHYVYGAPKIRKKGFARKRKFG